MIYLRRCLRRREHNQRHLRRRARAAPLMVRGLAFALLASGAIGLLGPTPAATAARLDGAGSAVTSARHPSAATPGASPSPAPKPKPKPSDDPAPSESPSTSPAPTPTPAPSGRRLQPQPVAQPVAKPAETERSTKPRPDPYAAPPNRIPAVGSEPRVHVGDAVADAGAGATGRASAWDFLPEPEVGVRIFVAGLIALVFSIGGLVTVAIRRRQW